MRWIALSLLMSMAQTANAWEFTPGLPCLLTHTAGATEIELTYDPAGPLYSISITQSTPFQNADIFAMQFDGARPIAISTDRHRLSNGNRTVTVMDRGFGNVLNGLQFNQTATATLGTQLVPMSLENAADPVAAFRACEAAAGV